MKLLSDIRFACRLLVTRRAFALAAVVPLAVALAAAFGMFAVVRGVLLRPLPFLDPDRLVVVSERNLSLGIDRAPVTLDTFLDWKERSHSLEGIEAYSIFSVGTPMGEGRDVLTASVSPGFFDVLGVPPLYRAGQQDGGPVISHGLWQRRFGQDMAVIGRRLEQEDLGLSFVIAGVMPRGFSFPPGVEAWYVDAPRRPAVPSTARSEVVIARLRPGIAIASARRELQAICTAAGRRRADDGWQVRIIGLEESLVGRTGPALWAVFASAALLLLIACANITSLLLGRVVERRREFDVRRAMGATLQDTMRQLLAENLVLGCIAGLAAAVLAFMALPGLLRLAPGLIPRADEIRLDGLVLLFAFAVVFSVVFLCTVISAWFVHRGRRQGNMPGRANVGGSGLFGWLSVTQIALATMLAIAAGVTLDTYARLQRVDLGFSPDRVSVTRFAPMPASYQRARQRLGLAENALWSVWMDGTLSRVLALPGVNRAAVGEYVPMEERDVSESPIRPVATRLEVDPREQPTAALASVSSEYFRVLGIRILAGRSFSREDDWGSEPVAVVSRAAAVRFWGSGDPIGQRVAVGEERESRRVVGVVADVRFVAPSVPAPAVVYLPFAQYPRPFLALVVDANVTASALAKSFREVLQTEGFRPVDTVPLGALLEATTAHPRFASWSATSFGSVALAVAASGIYCVLALGVRQRRRELAVRLALGAGRGRIIGMVFARAAVWLLVGLPLGIVGGSSLTALARGLLSGVSAVNVPIVAAVALLFGSVAVTAALGPALYAGRSDPAELLRSE
jgi:putative ABC transport system permease protein